MALCDLLLLKASSSIGRAPVSKTGCWGFESLLACHKKVSYGMTTSTEEKVYRLDALKWAIVVALVAAAVIGNSAFAAQPVLYRALVIIVMAAIALFVA